MPKEYVSAISLRGYSERWADYDNYFEIDSKQMKGGEI